MSELFCAPYEGETNMLQIRDICCDSTKWCGGTQWLLIFLLLINSNVVSGAVNKTSTWSENFHSFLKRSAVHSTEEGNQVYKINKAKHKNIAKTKKTEKNGKLVKEKVPYSDGEQASIDYKEAMQLLQAGDKTKASISLHKVLAKQPTHMNARVQLIDYYRSIGETAKVEELLQQGLNINDKEPVYIKQKALLLNEKSKHGEALSLLLTMPKARQDDQEYKALLALTYFHEGLFDLAQRNYNQLLRLNPKNSNWRLGLAVAQDAAGEYQGAIENFTKAHNCGGLDSDTLKYIQQRINTLQEYFATVSRSS